MKKIALLFTLLFSRAFSSLATEYHVSKSGNDTNPGTQLKPFLTISRAARTALAGDTVTVHGGIYREWVNPVNGGQNDRLRILYRAAENERVIIKGSEEINNWQKVEKGIWKVTIDNTLFGDYNPYQDSIYGDWFWNQGRIHHTGEVFLNEQSMYEVTALDSHCGKLQHSLIARTRLAPNTSGLVNIMNRKR